MAGHSWLRPRELGPNAAGAWPTLDDSLEHAYDSRWFVIRGTDLRAGDDVTVTLTLPPACTQDYTLLGFTDIRAKAVQLLAQLGSAGLLDADDMDSDDMDSDDMDSDDMDSDDMDSDDMDSDDMDSDDMDSDDMDSDDLVTDAIAQGELDQLRDVYASAQRHSLRAASVTPGPADEQIHMVARAGGADLYFRVRGHHGAFDPGARFTIAATVVRTDACGATPVCPRSSPLPPDVLLGRHETLILTHSGRQSLRLANDGERRRFVSKTLGGLARRVDGAVYDLSRDRRLAELYGTWDLEPSKRCVPLANAIVESIREIIAEFATHNPLRYLVLVGADDVIPFARIEDRAEISREWQWAGPYDADTPLGAALTYGFYLSDDPYGRPGPLDPRGRGVRVPAVAVGRLVESAADITAHLDWFGRQGCLGCLWSFLPARRRASIRIQNAVVSGYTFVQDLGRQIKKALGDGGTQVDADLVERASWSTDDLLTKLKQRGQLVAAQGHYSADTLVPADGGPRLLPTDPRLTACDLRGRLWMTIGCHSGHNIVDRETRPAYGRRTSWAETLLRRGATLIGGTGYQYADSDLLESSEKLYTYLAQQLVAASEVPLGRALIAAKRAYLEQKLQLRGIDEKVLGVATLYGLPMLAVRPVRPVAPPDVVQPSPEKAVKEATGTHSRGVTLVSGLAEADLKEAAHSPGTYFAVGDQVITRPFRPVLPGMFRDLSLPGYAPVGVLWVGGTYAPEAPHDPLISLPVLEERTVVPHYSNRAFLPARPFRISRRTTGATLVFAPMQYRFERFAPRPQGTRRLWQSADLTVYYQSNAADRSALLDAPALRSPRIAVAGGGFDVRIGVRHHVSAGETPRVLASYLDGRELRSVELAAGAARADGVGWVREYTGALPGPGGPRPFDPSTQRVFFQAVGANGRVSSLTNGGRLFGPTQVGARATTLRIQTQGAAGYRDRLKIHAELTLTASGAAVEGEILFRLGGSRLWARTTSGAVDVELTVAARPRPNYLVVASFVGDGDLLPSAAAATLRVEPAATELAGPRDGKLAADARTVVAWLQLGSDRDRRLGLRPVVVYREGVEHSVVYTDQDGGLRVSADEVGGPGTVGLVFEGDDRYLRSELAVTFDGALAEGSRHRT